MIRWLLCLYVVMFSGIPLAAEAASQQKPSRNRGIVVLADSPAVHKELKLIEKQVATVTTAVSAARQQLQQARQLADTTQRRQKQSDATKVLRTTLAAALNEEQRKRLFQIEIQWTSGAWMLLRTELRSVLELSKETRASIRDLAITSRDAAARLRAQQKPDNKQETQQKIRRLLAEARVASVKLLSAAQKQKWEAAQGAAFQLPTGKQKQGQ